MSDKNLQCPRCGSDVSDSPGMIEDNRVTELMEQNKKLQHRIKNYEQSITNHRKLLINHLQSLDQMNEE